MHTQTHTNIAPRTLLTAAIFIVVISILIVGVLMHFRSVKMCLYVAGPEKSLWTEWAFERPL